MRIREGFVIDPSTELLPDYKISPFSTLDLLKNRQLPESCLCDTYFGDRFSGRQYLYTINGRQAIYIALSYYNLNRNDLVTILTTSGNHYISSCVTNEIERFCNWSRKIEKKTRIILVNHEFGYPFENLIKLKEYNIPIIEDCAHSFFSQDKHNNIGNVGDFAIYSFPKMFPMQIGGLLLFNTAARLKLKNQIWKDELRHIKNVLSLQIYLKDKIIHDRISNYKYLRNKFKSLGFKERFRFDEGLVPGVFMFKADEHKLNLPEMKKHFYAHGIQCSVFYGEEAFFIPVHQALDVQDLDYFYEVMKSFINRNISSKSK